MCRQRRAEQAPVRRRGRDEMELKLRDGRYVLDGKHVPMELDGNDELAQRVALKLQVHRGTFLPMPDYGSRLYTLGRVRPAERETAARQFVLEALADEDGLTLETLELTEKDGEAALRLTLKRGSKTFDVETKI